MKKKQKGGKLRRRITDVLGLRSEREGFITREVIFGKASSIASLAALVTMCCIKKP